MTCCGFGRVKIIRPCRERAAMSDKAIKNGCGCLVLIGLVFLLCFKSLFLPLCTQDTITATVVKTERVTNSKGGKYLVFTDREVLQNTDCLILWKWDSSDVYGALVAGKTYRFEVYGWRWGFMSWYRNIVAADVVEADRKAQEGKE